MLFGKFNLPPYGGRYCLNINRWCGRPVLLLDYTRPTDTLIFGVSLFMSCFFPNLMRSVLDPGTGEIKHQFLGPAYLSNPLEFGEPLNFDNDKGESLFIVPCGKCLGCRCDYSRIWANRMIIELSDCNYQAIFVTLTYDRQHCPVTPHGDLTLNVRDIQLFMKRLRKQFPSHRIRYYLCGEYGSRTARPHYHAIIYGLALADFDDLRQFGTNQLGDPYYTSPKFESIWGNGFVMMSGVTYQTCGYVSRYCTKKQNLGKAFDSYVELGVAPPFNVSSRRPGIGLLNAADYVASGLSQFSVPTADGVHTVPLPKAFFRHVRENGDFVQNVGLDYVNGLCYSRRVDSYERLKSDLIASDKSFTDYLRQRTADFKRVHNAFPDRELT